MIIQAASRALTQDFRPRFRAAVFKSIGLTVLLFFGLWYALHAVGGWALGFLPYGVTYADAALGWLLGIGLLVTGGFVLAPVTALFAGLFLDDLADDIERNTSPGNPVGRALPFGQALFGSLRFLALVLGVNFLCLLLLVLPGINVAIFFFANGYLLGREYFDFVALRHRPRSEVKALRRQYGGHVFMGGLMMAFLLTEPIVNLLTPFLGAAMMVNFHRGLHQI